MANEMQFHLVVFNAAVDSAPQVISCPNVDALKKAIEEYVLEAKKTVHVFIFHGTRMPITAPSSSCSIKVGDEMIRVESGGGQTVENGTIRPLIPMPADN